MSILQVDAGAILQAKSFYGWVLQTEDYQYSDYGVVVEGRTATSPLADYGGLCAALYTATKLKEDSIIDDKLHLVSDSLTLIKQLTGEFKLTAPHLAPYHDYAMSHLKGFDWSAEIVGKDMAGAATRLKCDARTVDEKSGGNLFGSMKNKLEGDLYIPDGHLIKLLPENRLAEALSILSQAEA